jgi:4-amino-4-deoxy-L-arabinose transferase-like glycosyltransferase
MTTIAAVPAAEASARRFGLAYAPSLPLWALRLVVGYFVVAKLAYSAVVPPNLDEAYYFLWGQHPQLSYLDHAPLVGWGSIIGMQLFGWTPIALHLVPLLGFAIVAWVMWFWAGRLAPAQRESYFWASIATFLASPLLMALTTVTYPDALLIPLSLLAMTALAVFLAHWEAGEKRWRLLYLGGALVGIAMLAKYNGAFVGIGLFIAILRRPQLRPLLRLPHLYLAGLLALAFLLPVLVWNMQNGFEGLRLHAVDRFADRGTGFAIGGVITLLWQTVLNLSPLLIWPLLRFLLVRDEKGFAGALHAIAFGMVLTSTLATTALSAWVPAAGQVIPHWNIMGLMPFAALAPLLMRSRWLVRAHLLLGGLIAGLVVLYYIACPLPVDALHIEDGEAVVTFGEDQVAAAAKAAATAQHTDFIGAMTYSFAAKLSFGAGDGAGIISISPYIDQYDLWVDPNALAGKTALVVTEWADQPGKAAPLFDSLTKVGEVTSTRFGHKLWTFGLYLGRGYHPVPPP